MGKLNLNALIGDTNLEMTCPGCGNQVKVKFKELSKANNKVRCRRCNKDITITHNSKTKKELANVDQSLKELENSIKKLGK